MSRHRIPTILIAIMAFTLATAVPGQATETIKLVLRDHRFEPSEITVPAGEKFTIELENTDDTPEEFDSADLRVEKIVVPGGRITIPVHPLKPGRYAFTGEYHSDTASGAVVATEGTPQ